MNNSGQSMIRQTQDQWLKSKYIGSSYSGGLPKINFLEIAKCFDLNTEKLTFQKNLKKRIRNFY